MFDDQIVRASSYGVPVTIHAGEWPTEGGLNTIENVHFAWRELNVRRIGHGIALRADEDFEKTILEMKSHLGNEGELKPITIEVMRFSKKISVMLIIFLYLVIIQINFNKLF